MQSKNDVFALSSILYIIELILITSTFEYSFCGEMGANSILYIIEFALNSPLFEGKDNHEYW